MSESCHTYEWVMSHIWVSHVTHASESCRTYESQTHLLRSSYMYIYRIPINRIQMSHHVTYLYIHIVHVFIHIAYKCIYIYVAYKYIMYIYISHTNKSSCHTCIYKSHTNKSSRHIRIFTYRIQMYKYMSHTNKSSCHTCVCIYRLHIRA